MVSGALPLLPTTKVGAGDKERAYVIRQNVVLKALLIAASVLLGVSTLLCCTVYEVHVQRRVRVDDAREHREEEHADQRGEVEMSEPLVQQHPCAVHDDRAKAQAP